MSIGDLIATLEPEIVALRRQIHEHPELGWREVDTAKIVEAFLQKHGYVVKRVAGTGLVADLAGTAQQPSAAQIRAQPLALELAHRRIAIRADLDALPVFEETGLPFASKNAGVMHCCGHDMHASMVAGLAAVLARMAGELRGDVRFIFQPAEEGGRSTSQQPGQARSAVALSPRRGAQRMMDEGALDGVDAVLGIHCWPDLPVGTLGVDPKAAMAGNAALRVKVIGKGGHGATPHKTVDPVPMTANLILALQTIASRRNNPANPFVLTIGTIHGGTTSNVIPDSVEFAATLRSYTPGYLETTVPPIIEQMTRGIVEGCGGTVEMEYTPGLPPVINDSGMVKAFTASARRALGEGAVVLLEDASMTSEDFAYYSQAIPGLYVKLGVAGRDGCPPLHNARFSPDERAIATGLRAMAGFAVDLLAGR